MCCPSNRILTLNVPIPTKVVCFSHLLKCFRSLYGKQCGHRSDCAVCSGSTLFASILNLSVMLGNYFQQTTSADDIFRCIFFLGALRFKSTYQTMPVNPNYLPSNVVVQRNSFVLCIKPYFKHAWANALKLN